MKRMFLFTAMASLLFAINANAQTVAAKKVSNKSATEAYDVANKNITLGNQAYAQKVLWAWRYFQDNTIDKMKDLFTDDVTVGLPDGSMVKGADNVISTLKDFRNELTSVESEVDACTALHSDSHPDAQVVSIWGTDSATGKDGKSQKTYYNEVWFFNKDGKVFQVFQTAAKVPEEK